MTPPAEAITTAIARGPIDAADALPRSDVDRLVDPVPLPVETGWARLPDGVAYAAVRTELPGVTAEMVDWWFQWHPHASIRYRIWFPGAHESISLGVRTERRDAGPTGAARARALWGTTHHPVEDIGLGMDRLRIDFRSPAELGFAAGALDDPRVATIVGGVVGDTRRHVRHTAMVHVFLNANDGLVMRSRFWIGAVIAPYLPEPAGSAVGRLINRPTIRRVTVPRPAAQRMAEHCAAEYANLATLLPERFGDGPPTPVSVTGA